MRPDRRILHPGAFYEGVADAKLEAFRAKLKLPAELRLDARSKRPTSTLHARNISASDLLTEGEKDFSRALDPFVPEAESAVIKFNAYCSADFSARPGLRRRAVTRWDGSAPRLPVG